ncbi:c2 domain-containing protein [Hordeum vulgare]|nr:c2 domain-containing protein [Hordeum vulgare]
MLLVHLWVFQALEAFNAQYKGKSFNLTHFWMINGKEKFKVQYATIKAHGGNATIEEHGEVEKPQLQGKTNSKKKDKCEAASLSLQLYKA